MTVAHPIRTNAIHLAVALLAVLLIASLAPERAAAHGTGLPAHQIGAVGCGQSFVRTNPPRQMSSWYAVNLRNAELVHWTPQLFRWNAAQRSWQLVATRPWHRAFTSIYGYYQMPYVGAWQNTATNAGVMFVPFHSLSPGYYAIRNVLYWNRTGVRHLEWSQYCYVG